MKINNFALIIGAMKCGTTSLFKYLAQHLQISACKNKEPLFFSNKDIFSRGFDYYQSLWDWNSNQHKIALEATVSYTRVTHTSPSHLNAAENIAKIKACTNANFKFIYIIRDPIDRIESHYTNGRAHLYKDTAKPLSEGINSEIIDTSKYAMQIEEYYKRFPHESILLLNFENLKNEPLNVVRKVCRFLDIDPDYKFQGLNINHNPYNPIFRRVTLPGYSSIRKTKFVKSIVRQIPDETRIKLQPFRKLLTQKKY
ncbi:sulfotransferase [Pleurocapsa sp. PCC 7319]|uniref:sulfotransferase family protein n=1 Tax=Pleurocapsa sp. PCC 7319 TaxID=118161 RepID=UPI0003462EA7|nr:sulfotransferase [Pleurocapsa sp. PCC 7319]